MTDINDWIKTQYLQQGDKSMTMANGVLNKIINEKLSEMIASFLL